MEVKNLKYKYNKSNKYTLEDVSFTLKKDKLNVLVGLNGSGKTTLFDCITGVLKPESGIITLPDVNNIMYLTQTIFFSFLIKGKDLASFILQLDVRPLTNSKDFFYKDLSEREKELFDHLWDMKWVKCHLGRENGSLLLY